VEGGAQAELLHLEAHAPAGRAPAFAASRPAGTPPAHPAHPANPAAPAAAGSAALVAVDKLVAAYRAPDSTAALSDRDCRERGAPSDRGGAVGEALAQDSREALADRAGSARHVN
jgi:hypothetical protein